MLKKLFYIPYTLIRWLILITILLSLLLLLIVEHPSFALNLVKGSLEEQNISYESIEGGLLSGFTLKNVNYQDQLKASEVGLKVDLEQLRNRVLYINEITLTGVEVKQEFLASLVDSNSSDENKSESNTTLPFDSIVLEHADIDLNNIVYENYDIKKAKLEVRNLSSDMKKQHKGDVKLLLESNVTHLDFNASINNEKLKMIATVVPNRNFINPLISEQNITLTSNPHLLLKADGNMQEILNYHLTANHLEIKQNEHRIKGEKLLLFGNYNMAKSNLEATLDTKLDGSMAYLKANAHTKLNLDDLNNTLNYKLETTINPKAQFLSALLSEQNISLQASPNIHLKSSGSLNKLTYHLTATQLKLKQNEYQVHKGKIELQGDYSVLEQDLKAKLTSAIDTNMANLDLQADTKLNLTDINNTLVFDIQSNIAGKKDFAGAKLSEQNITLITLPQMNINAKGTLKEAIFDTNIRGFKAKQNDINIELQSLLLKGKTNALKGDTDLELSSDFDSSAGSGHLDTLATLNFNQLEETLTFDAKSNIDANAVFINPFIKKEGITVKGSPKLLLEAKGNLQNITAKLNANAQVLKDNNLSKITLQSTPINLNLKDHTVEGSIKLASDSKNMGLNLQSNFKGDYTNPQALQTDTKLNLKNFNAFGLNLDPIAPLKLLIQNGANGAIVKIDSERIKLNAKTADHDHFSFDIKTRNLYLYKMMELPPELDHKFVKLDLAGTAILSKEFFDIKGDIHSNKKFKAHINAKNNTSGIDALIKTQYLIASLQGNLKTKNLKAEIQSGSLKKLQKELNAVYAFKMIEVDGRLSAKATLKGEEASVRLDSKKLTFDGFNIEGLGVNAHYNNDLVTLNKLSFNTTGFKDKKLNQKFYLNQKGKIHLGKRRDVMIDMHPNIMVKASGDENSLNGTFKIKKLPLGHPAYGSAVLNTDIKYQQQGLDKEITGDIDLQKIKLFYEAKFLDADYDPDVVIITKKDKNKKEKSEDNFLKHTFIDLKIHASEANYKTPDIDLLFDINLKANKEFNKELALLGKIEEINGRVDQVPKRFEVTDSNIVFKGGKKINPLLDINVEYELPQVLINIAIGGNANRPKLEFTSEPPMPKKDIMSYLLLGVSTASLAEGEGSLSREAELFIINQAARDLAYEFELDRVFVKDDGTGEGFAVEAGKNVSKKNMLIIESSKVGNSYILEHDINKNIKLRAGQHQKEQPSQSLDIYFRKKFK